MSFRSLVSTTVPVAILGLALAGPGAAASGQLVIPRIGLKVPIARTLSAGPVVYFRDADTIGIAGHRTTYTRPFFRLPTMRRGDRIWFGGRLYRVRSTAVVRPWQVWVLRHRGLVLSACHPAGSANYRFVVLARPAD